MNVSVVNQFYLPDSVPTAQLAGSLAESLAAAGHRVTVVTGHGAYVGGQVRTDHDGNDRPNLTVRRLWTPGMGKRRVVTRLLDYGAFYLQAAWTLLTLPRQDAVVALTTPPLIALAAWCHRLRNRDCRLVLWNMDSYPEIAVAAGHLRHGSLAARLMRGMNRFLFRRLDLVVALDRLMADSLKRSYAPDATRPGFAVVPNWERLADFPPGDTACDGPIAFSHDRPMTVLYLGNAGSAHTFETVVEAAAAMRDEPVRFLFVGGGSRWPELQKACAERRLTNVEFRGYVPKSETQALMAGCDLALITLADGAGGLVSPSKLHAYLACRLPAVYVGPAGSNVDEAIAAFRVGFSLRPGDSGGLTRAVREVMHDKSLRDDLRCRARKAFETRYCDTQAVPQLIHALERCVAGATPSPRA